MKINRLLASIAAVAFSTSAYAEIVLPSTGDSEIVFIALDFGGTTNSFTLDTGTLLSAFDPSVNRVFDLSALSTFWGTFKGSVTGVMQFGLFAADGVGSGTVANGRSVLVTSAVGGGPTGLSNSVVSARAGGITGTFLAGISGAADNASFTSTHRDLANGSSISLGGGGTTGSDTFNANWTTPLNSSLQLAGTKAEFFKISTVTGTNAQPASVTDFFSSTETSTNVGGFWNLDLATNLLTYKGAPDIVIVPPPPVPEPSEWAMMLAGLGLVGFAARRRAAKRKISA